MVLRAGRWFLNKNSQKYLQISKKTSNFEFKIIFQKILSMVATIDNRKIQLINALTNIEDDFLIQQLESLLLKKQSKKLLLEKLAKPRRAKMDIETLKKEQNYQGFDRVKFDKLVREINLQEPLEK